MLPAELKQLDDLSRRQFMANVAKCSLGVSLLFGFGSNVSTWLIAPFMNR